MNFQSIWHSLKKIKKPYLLYGIIIIGFTVWMLFLDTHSWAIHSELNQEIEKLEKEQKVLKEIIKEDLNSIEVLQNQDSLERFARENYGHKKNNETIFIIELKDTLN